jgi:predicted Zn-dependent peptidase
MNKTYTAEQFGVTKHHGTLKNGLKVIFIRKPFSPIRMHLVLRGGSVFDPPGKEGLSHFVEHIIMNGSSTKPQKEFWNLAESIGAYANARTKKQCVQVEFEIATKDHLPQAREYFSHAISEIYITEQMLEKEKGIIVSEIEKSYSRPRYDAERFISSKLANGSSWGTENLGSIKSVLDFSVKDVEDFFSTHYTVENMGLIVAGDCTWDDIVSTFSDISILKGQSQELPSEPDFIPFGTKLAYEDNNPEMKIYYGFRQPGNFTRPSYLLRFALRYVHGGLGTLFLQRIREEKALVYSVNMSEYCFDRNGYIGTTTGTPTDRVSEVLEAIHGCYTELINQPITQEQINNKVLTGWYHGIRSHEESVDWVNSEGLDIIYPDPPLPFGSYPDIHNYHATFTSTEIESVIQEFIVPYNTKPYLFLTGRNAERYL